MQRLKRVRDVIAVEGTEGRNPFEVLLLLWPLLAAGSYALGRTSGDNRQVLPYLWMVIAWYTLLCIGGLVGLVGVWLRNQTLSLLWERAAMAITGGTSLIFAAILLAQSDPEGRAAGIGVLLYCLAALWRLLRIQFFLIAARDKLRSLQSEAVEK